MKYEFTEDYLTGIADIDEEHRHLFAIANEAYDLLTDKFRSDKFDKIKGIMAELRRYTKEHFAHEEAYMESINYKKRFSQQVQHAAFVEKLDGIDLEKVDANQEDALIDVLEFLADWLQKHIKGMDCQIGK